MTVKKSICFILIVSIAISCTACSLINEDDYRVTNINIYKDTEAWELAKAVKNQDTKKIEKIAEEEPELFDFQDPKFKTTLLVWAVGMEKYHSAEALLKGGADPDIISGYEGGTALYLAAGFSWVDNDAKKDARFVKLLLQYGADPNINYVGREAYFPNDGTEMGTSPLMQSIGCGLEKTKALVEGGADINYKTPLGKTAAISSLHWNEPEYTHYLIVEKKATITEPYHIVILPSDDPNEKFYPVDSLRIWIYELDSNEYKLKMEIIDEFMRQGVNYWDTEIPAYILEIIKKSYPDTWEEYIKKY